MIVLVGTVPGIGGVVCLIMTHFFESIMYPVM
jgi:hypothetical protein